MASKVISKMSTICFAPYWCNYEAITERKATKCLDFSYFKLNDLEMTIKVTGKTFVNFLMKVIHTSVCI